MKRLNESSAPTDSQVDSEAPLLRLQIDLFEFGKERALGGAAEEESEDDLRPLVDHAKAIARETSRTKYEPKTNTHDRLREGEYKKVVEERAEVEKAARFSAATLREAEAARAEVPPAGTRPAAQPILIVAAIVLLAVSVAPTAHDQLFGTLPDDLLAWFFSIVTGGAVGGFLTWAILGSVDGAGERSMFGSVGLVSGVIISIALGALRIAGADGFGEVLFALALTGIEIGVVLLLEKTARSLRASRAVWSERNDVEVEAIARLDAAGLTCDRHRERLDELKGKVKDHLRYVENRTLRNLGVAEIVDVAVKAVRDGYAAGVAENKGRLLGVRRGRR